MQANSKEKSTRLIAFAVSPYILHQGEHDYCVRYEPAESTTSLFGGNSSCRPVIDDDEWVHEYRIYPSPKN